MLYILDNGTIQLTRGDTARLTVDIFNDDTEYEIQENDLLTFTVRKTYKSEHPIFQKTVTGSTSFHIEPTDTDGLNFGQYKYDVQLTMASGDIYTVVEPNNFELMPEVTY